MPEFMKIKIHWIDEPNKSELALLEIISPLGFIYVGDGSLIIKRKNLLSQTK